jgi:hypothetical protein
MENNIGYPNDFKDCQENQLTALIYMYNKNINVKELNISLRVQNYIKSKSKVVIGYQGGFGTDCMPRYTKCYVVPLVPGLLAEHILPKTTYLY